MQVVIQVNLSVEQYIEQGFHRRIRAPAQCGNCKQFDTLSLLGYYDRYTTDEAGKAAQIRVARFRCNACPRTTSCLPAFCQPYLFVGSKTIEDFFQGNRTGNHVLRCEEFLMRYLKCFTARFQRLSGLVGNRFGRGPPKETATAFWRRAVAACGSLAELTIRLVEEFRTTCFGTYRCHQSTSPH